MTVCDHCGQIEMNSIGDICLDFQLELHEMHEADDDQPQCDECGSYYHRTEFCAGWEFY
jgi:hypothetical protein